MVLQAPGLFGTANTNRPAIPPISMNVQYGIRLPNLITVQSPKEKKETRQHSACTTKKIYSFPIVIASLPVPVRCSKNPSQCYGVNVPNCKRTQ